MTSCKLGRDAEFQAIIPVRGKTLNCLKSSYDKIFKSEIIVYFQICKDHAFHFSVPSSCEQCF